MWNWHEHCHMDKWTSTNIMAHKPVWEPAVPTRVGFFFASTGIFEGVGYLGKDKIVKTDK